MKIFEVLIFNEKEELVESFEYEAITPKGVEKSNKIRFKEYRKLGYSWTIEESE